MRAALIVLLLLGALLGSSAPVSRAQEDELSAAPENETKPYVPPPAWKSVEIADFYLKRKRYRAAFSRYQEAVRMDPYYAPGHLGLGRVYEKFGLKQKALEAYRKYLELLPSAKEAEEARDVHKAIARLERQLKSSNASRPPRASGPAATSSPQ